MACALDGVPGLRAFRLRRRHCWGVLLAVLAGVAQALGGSDPAALYHDGAYDQAYQLAVAVDSGPMQTLAAQAAIARGLYQESSDQDALAWLRKGEAAAREAVRLTPDAPAALLALAQAKGEIARRTGPLANLSVPGDIGSLLKKAVRLAPKNPDALVGLGLWNLELSARGVGWMYGAKRGGALAMVARGVALAPDRADLRVQYASALRIVGDVQREREQLREALALRAGSALERYEQQRARELLKQLDSGSG